MYSTPIQYTNLLGKTPTPSPQSKHIRSISIFIELAVCICVHVCSTANLFTRNKLKIPSAHRNHILAKIVFQPIATELESCCESMIYPTDFCCEWIYLRASRTQSLPSFVVFHWRIVCVTKYKINLLMSCFFTSARIANAVCSSLRNSNLRKSYK